MAKKEKRSYYFSFSSKKAFEEVGKILGHPDYIEFGNVVEFHKNPPNDDEEISIPLTLDMSEGLQGGYKCVDLCFPKGREQLHKDVVTTAKNIQ